MAERFSTHAATFFTAVLQPLARYAKANAGAIGAQTEENIVTAFAAVMGVPAVSAPSFAALGPALPPALSGSALPSGLAPGLGIGGGGGAPAKGKRATGSGGKAALAQQRWISLDQYRQEHGKRVQACAYQPNRGEKKGLVCGGPAVNIDDPDQLKWRCVCCTGKQGEISKKPFGATTGMAPRTAPGFNIPSAAPSSIPAMPIFGSLPMPGATSGLPTLSGVPALPTAGLPPSLPPSLPSLTLPGTGLPSLPGGGLPAPGGLGLLPGLPGLPGVSSVPPLPLGLPLGTTPPPMPNPTGGLPLPGGAPTLPTGTPAATPVVEEKLKVIENEMLPSVYFVQDEKFRQLAIMAHGDEDLVCIGKVTGFTPAVEGAIPEKWSAELVEPSAEDFAYLKTFGVLYNFKSASPTPAAIA